MNIHKVTTNEFTSFSVNFLHEKFKKLEVKQKKVNIALAGGNTPIPILNMLKDKPLLWEKYNFFMVDERIVALDNPDSNYGNIKHVFFDKIPAKSFSILKENITVDESVEIYAKEILENLYLTKNNIPVFDLIILGMGDDGHIASLFPGTVALNETNQIVIKNYVPKLEAYRLTMTYPILLDAREIIILIKGKSKMQVLDNIKTKNTDYPIKRITDTKVKQSFIIGL